MGERNKDATLRERGLEKAHPRHQFSAIFSLGCHRKRPIPHTRVEELTNELMRYVHI